jgi:hypothetical protein
VNRDRVRQIFTEHGFTIKEGQTDLREYVYEAAEALTSEMERRLTVLDKLFWLAARDFVFFSTYNSALEQHDDHWYPAVCVNDTFWYASADAEDLREDEIDGLIDIVKRFDYDGVVAWAAKRRNATPIKERQTEKYFAALEYLSTKDKT